ncbi:MAG: PEGA domain-containing protein [Vicinamibacteraceae bacterium]
MKHLIWTIALTASLAAPLPAAAQHAVPRGGGGGGSDGGGSSSGGSSSGGGGGSTTSSGGSSSGGSSSGGSSSGGGSSWAPPRHPGGSGSSGSGRSRGGDSGSTASGRRSPGGSSSGSDPDRVVGGTSGGRTRDGRPITGYAIPRGVSVPSGRPGGDYYYYPRGTDWYYSPFYYSRYSPYYYSGFGASMWGLGYIWDPFWFGPGYSYSDPFGVGDPYGYGGGGGYAAGDEPEDIEGQGGLRIKVKPRDARVMVDGTFAGTVDDFDGNFQRLRLDEGAHKVELQADGFEPLRFDVLIVDGQTVTYKGNLRQR